MARITELANGITRDIDKCDPIGIVRLLCQSDAQLFSGWGDHASISDTAILHKIDNLSNKAAALLQENEQNRSKNAFIFTGCGTSGRIAWACSRSFNRLLRHFQKEPCFDYLIAGGDKALIVGDELPEDDPPRGAKDLMDASSGVDHVMVVGVTCGLSAPYVAGQLDLAMKLQDKFTPVLLGFNPVELARDTKIEKWNKTCKQTFQSLAELEESGKGMVLNPIVGPEPITGSSRMKGGSMTAILLDIIFTLAISRAFSLPLPTLLHGPVPDLHSELGKSRIPVPGSTTRAAGIGMHTEVVCHALDEGQRDVALLVDAFSATYNAAYRPVSGIASLVSTAADCLRQRDGHVYYVGAQLFGVVGFIDSSEMVSTFGSSPHEIRGFVEGGWETCRNREGDLSEKGPLFHISLADFERNILPTLRSCDCVIVCTGALSLAAAESSDAETLRLSVTTEKILQSPAQCCLLAVVQIEHTAPSHLLDHRYRSRVVVRIPYSHVAQQEPLFGAFALKLILNAVSTGVNILKGKVYHNTMINLTVANDKLFHRSTQIVADISKVDLEDAERALLRAIYRENTIDKHLLMPVSEHIKAAAKNNMVVPLAILLASRQCKVEEALNSIAAAKSLRVLVESSRIERTSS